MRLLVARLVCTVLAQNALLAQSTPLKVGEAVEQALQNYPAVQSSIEQTASAAAAINLARTSYLPRADFMGQLNRATHNNVFGQLLPQAVIPSMSGPVLNTNTGNSVWGSAVGVLVSWEPFDFGLRRANVDAARSTRDRKAAETTVTKLQVATAAADAFLTLAAAQQAALAAQAGVERSRVLNEVLESLAKNELRPGADASRTRAELALAQTQQIQTEQARDVARAALAKFLINDPNGVAIEPGPLLNLPPETALPIENAAEHPLALVKSAAVMEVKSRETVLNRSYFPKFDFESAAFARGTGVQADGRTGGDGSGLGPNIQNWNFGASIAFPSFDWFSIHAKKEIEAHNERSAKADYDQTLRDVKSQVAQAKAVLDAARRVAQNTPIQLQAARDSEQQATARYKAGLGNIAEVAEAERLLTQAEIDDALAKLGIWRAILGVAAAQGDLTPFLTAAAK